MKRATEVLVNFVIIAVVISVALCATTGGTELTFGESTTSAIYHGDTAVNNVSLMINVYWGTEYIQPILAILREYDAHVTFFVGGMWASSNGQFIADMLVDGHEIGNHGYFHKQHSKLSYDQNYSEINTTHQVILDMHSYSMTLFAPPSGDYNSVTINCATKCGYTTVMWSKDTIDWRDKDSDLVYTRATKNAKNGDLILMHPTAHTLEALVKILEYYKQNNLVVTTVSNNINGVINDYNKTIY